ncbi:hypothetical protein IV454_14710 [Massilia antarctica]|uniref:Uncharacterized protein n=1 Tax=Massilia antarctica TaxID=2765360 RepID=A0AA49AAI1_9BURK|nr:MULTISPECIES: hypothetical protein [Massilia]MCY0913116.1 hypothetical protein [Massilia sp. H27-R4]QPI52623.1 hypothetical protein IV454_14710 [Massilia antarctica]
MCDILAGPTALAHCRAQIARQRRAQGGIAPFLCKGHYPVRHKKRAAKTSLFATFHATKAKILSFGKFAELNIVHCSKLKILDESVLQQNFPSTHP